MEEEKLCLQTFAKYYETYPQLKLILVPRHPERFDEVMKLCDQSKIPYHRRSDLSDNSTSDSRLLLVDVIGELGPEGGLTDIALVGGSMGSREGRI